MERAGARFSARNPLAGRIFGLQIVIALPGGERDLQPCSVIPGAPTWQCLSERFCLRRLYFLLSNYVDLNQILQFCILDNGALIKRRAMGDIIPQEIDSTKAEGAPDARICPRCSSAQRTRRIPRPLWMRLIPSSLNMMCGHCGHHFWLVS